MLVPQQGRRLTPSIIESIVNEIKNYYWNSAQWPQNHSWNIVTMCRASLNGFINQFAPLITQNFSNTTILEPFWNNAQTRTESVRNAEAINNNTLPIGIYSSNNMSIYASIRY